jgi:hypothetical protein
VIALERNLTGQAVAAVAELQLDPLDRNVLAAGDALRRVDVLPFLV